jgi:ATP-dependent Clp protease ATP-binding subunit ClpA
MARPTIGFSQKKRVGDDEDAIKRLFTPEFRNRLDAVIQFGHLPEQVIAQVVEKFVLQLEAQLADRHVTIELTPEAARWLAERGYDEQMGARPLARVIQENIKKPLADEVLFGRLVKGGHVRVGVAEDALSFDIEPAQPRSPSGSGPKKPKVRKPRDGSGGSGGGTVPKVPLLVE